MTEYEVTWLTANHAEMDTDSVEDAVAVTRQMKADGKIRIVGLCGMRVKDRDTGKTTIVHIDQEWKVVEAHELD